ncbi:hypothetical protein [Streptomyces sp. NBC_01454]|uniref:hypothetical protein n=1 Tax=Streptomyces sp. NBC_01454 TaxID=2975867 RepID=UPI002E35512C|nr:hypothetical protein [Streptomyces sp. NBC_01454]
MNASPQTFNVVVQQVSGTQSSKLGSSFNAGSIAPVTGTALASPGEMLTVDIKVTNSRGGANTVTATVTDPSGSNGFLGQGSLSWDDGDDGAAWIEFTGFPRQADQVTETGECEYSLTTSGDDVSVTVFTI